MDLMKIYYKEKGIDLSKHLAVEGNGFAWFNYSEWLEARCSFRDVSENPTIPFLGLWSDGKMTVFDSEDDSIDYAINAPVDKWKPAKLIKWMPLPIIERGTDAEP